MCLYIGPLLSLTYFVRRDPDLKIRGGRSAYKRRRILSSPPTPCGRAIMWEMVLNSNVCVTRITPTPPCYFHGRDSQFGQRNGHALLVRVVNRVVDGLVGHCHAALGLRSEVLAALIEEARLILHRYRDHRRASAQLDFDDLNFAARDLLRDRDDERDALGQRFAHVLVDKSRIPIPCRPRSFAGCAANQWAMPTGPASGSGRALPGRRSQAGDLSLPRRRCRRLCAGARRLRAQDPESLLSISTNFRSRASILTFVNERFEAVLSVNGAAIFLGGVIAKFPSLAGGGSAVGLIGASIL